MSIFKLQVKQKFAQEYKCNYGISVGLAGNNIYTCVIGKTDLTCYYAGKKGRIYAHNLWPQNSP